MEVQVDSSISKSIAPDQVTVIVASDKATSRAVENRQDVLVQDSYDIAPTRTRLSIDYKLPSTLTDGLFVDVDQLRTFYNQLNGEVGTLQTTTYSKTETDQLFTNIQGFYVQNTDLQSKVVALDFSQAKITPSGATFQQINDRIVSVEQSTASHTQDIQIQANNYGSAVSRVEVLEASSDTYNAKITDLAVVAAGQFPFWTWVVTGPTTSDVGKIVYTINTEYPNQSSVNNTTQDPIAQSSGVALPTLPNASYPIGYRFRLTTTDVVYENITDVWTVYNADTTASGPNLVWQYLGSDLESTNDGWRQIENKEGTFGAAKSIYTDSNGAIVGWAYKGGSGSPSEFVIRADTFKVASASDSTKSELLPLVIDTVNHTVKFTGLVDFTSLGTTWSGTSVDNSKVTINDNGTIKYDGTGSGAVTVTGIGGDTSATVTSKAATAENNAKSYTDGKITDTVAKIPQVGTGQPTSTSYSGKNLGHVLREEITLSTPSVLGATKNYVNWILSTTSQVTTITYQNNLGQIYTNSIYTIDQLRSGGYTILSAYGWLPTGGTIIDGGNIVTGSISADHITANSITSNEINTDTINAVSLKDTSINLYVAVQKQLKINKDINYAGTSSFTATDYSYAIGTYTSGQLLTVTVNYKINTETLYKQLPGFLNYPFWHVYYSGGTYYIAFKWVNIDNEVTGTDTGDFIEKVYVNVIFSSNETGGW